MDKRLKERTYWRWHSFWWAFEWAIREQTGRPRAMVSTHSHLSRLCQPLNTPNLIAMLQIWSLYPIHSQSCMTDSIALNFMKKHQNRRTLGEQCLSASKAAILGCNMKRCSTVVSSDIDVRSSSDQQLRTSRTIRTASSQMERSLKNIHNSL